MRKLAVVNQKGGAGKTTVSEHVGQAGVEAGLRVLLVDLDAQRSLSRSHLPGGGEGDGILTASMLFSAEPVAAQPAVLSEQLSIIPADKTLYRLASTVAGIEKRPAMHLSRLASKYDLCVIDTPGSIGFNPPMTVAALCAADAVVCPFNMGRYEAEALADLWEYLKAVKRPEYNPRLRLMGLLPSKIKSSSKKEMAALEALRKQFGNAMVPGMLADRSAVKQAVDRGQPVWRNTKGAGHLEAAREWRGVCNYILTNLGVTK
jgi:chromosome partitioning protein